MELEILNKTENPLFSRTKVDFSLAFEGKPTPSKEEVLKKISEKMKAKPEVVHITEVHTSFGKGVGTASALIYTSTEERQKLEPQKKSKEEGAKADAPVESADAPKEAPNAEKEEGKKDEAEEPPKAEEA